MHRQARAPALRVLAAKLGRIKWSNYLNLPTTCAFFGLATGCGPFRWKLAVAQARILLAWGSGNGDGRVCAVLAYQRR